MRRSSFIVSIIAWMIPIIGLATSPALSQTVPLPSQPDGTDWPTQVWPSAKSNDPSVDVSALLDPVFASDIDDPQTLGRTRGVIIVKGGRIVHERYADGIDPDMRHVSWSVAKSITTTLVGRAVQQGLIRSIDDPMPAAFEEGDPRGNISRRHWLQLLDGLEYRELDTEGLIDNDAVMMLYAPGRYDQLAYARENFHIGHAAGTRWNYSTATFHLVARALQSLLPGTCVQPKADPRTCEANPRIMSQWVDTVLFDPLGIDGVVEFDASGTMLGGSSAYMSVRDYARFGLLILRDGMWDGKRLLPEGWVDFNRTNPGTADSNVYGGGFWPSPEVSDNPEITHLPPYDAFHAGGREGQLVWIVPSRDLVIVRVGLMRDEGANWNRLFEWAQQVGAAVD